MQMKRSQTYKKKIDNIISSGNKTSFQRKLEVNQFLVSLYKRQSQVLIFCNQNKISIETTIAIVSVVTQYLEDKLVAINNNGEYNEEILQIKLN